MSAETSSTKDAAVIHESPHDTHGLVVPSELPPILGYVVLSLVSVIAAFQSVLAISTGAPTFPTVLPPLAFFIILLYFFLTQVRHHVHAPSYIFFLAATPAVLSFALFILPDQIPDEIWHFFRALNFVSLGNGGMVSPSSIVWQKTPTSYRELAACLSAPADWGSTYVVTRDMSAYLSHLYVFSGLAVNVGRLMGLNPFVAYYLGRIANGCVFVLTGCWVINQMPLGKTIALIYFLNPMLIQQEASYSADAMVNVISFVFIAVVLSDFAKEHINSRDVVTIVVLSLLVCISKYAYAPLLLSLLLFLPRVPLARTRRAVVIGLIALFLLASYYLLFCYSGALMKPTIELVRSPITCAKILARSIAAVGPFWIESFLGNDLGNLTIHPWVPVFWLYGLLLVLSVFVNDDDNQLRLGTRHKVLAIAGPVISAVLIVLALRDWSVSVENVTDYIVGVQGRYFLPLVIWPLICAERPDSTAGHNRVLLGYAVAIALVYVSDIYAIVAFFL